MTIKTLVLLGLFLEANFFSGLALKTCSIFTAATDLFVNRITKMVIFYCLRKFTSRM